MATTRDMGRGDKAEKGALDGDPGVITRLADVGIEVYGR